MKRKLPLKKKILRVAGIFLVLIIAGSIFLYYTLNRRLTDALIKSFNENIVSDVYELKFEKLSVNLLKGDVEVYNVELQPRKKPLVNYPYINSSFRLTTKKMELKNVQILTLLKSKKLKLEKIIIIEPEVESTIAGKRTVFFPFKDTVAGSTENNTKHSIESYFLKEFDMVDASIHATDTIKGQDFRVKEFNISLRDILIDQQPGRDLISYLHFNLLIGEFTGSLKKEALRNVNFKDFKINIDSLHVEQTLDTLTYRFTDFNTGLKKLDIQTADSLRHFALQSFDLSYKDKSIKLNDVIYRSNVSQATIQADFKYQNTQFTGTVGTLNLLGVNFDTLVYTGKIFIDEIILDKISATVYSDKTKPVDPNNFPQYLGQSVKDIGSPLLIKKIKATNINLVNKERNPDGTYITTNLNRGAATVKNITNLSSSEMLMLNIDTYIENKASLNINFGFSYQQPQFTFNGSIGKFDLPGLNKLIQGYTPATVNKGTVDGITFSGTGNRTSSTGTMKFLFHDLNISMELPDKAKWKNSLLTFSANTFLPSANPAKATLPPRVVQFNAERNMNKSFINFTIKSIMAGLKETMKMSKENKKAFREEKKEARKEAKKEKKEERKKQ
ncbi:MAG: DUF748 domain-containing protein [Bacteroidetes bacterium]|nr:MAG: DUF748 domain-containing protein [Bacteroidota bacterium]